MALVNTHTSGLTSRSVTDRFVELSDKLNTYLERFREFGIRSNRAVAHYLGVDSAELSRLKNARVGDINIQRGYEILANCEELVRRLSTFGGPMKVKDVYSVGFNVAALPAVNSREQMHAIALHQQTDSVLLTVDIEAQRRELDMLIGEVFRSVIHPRRNPYFPLSILYVLKSAYAAPGSTPQQMLDALRIVHIGRRACQKAVFNPGLGEEVRLRTLAGILNNGGGIALRLAKVCPSHGPRLLKLAKFLHVESLKVFYFPVTLRGALTVANDLRDEGWAKELLEMLMEREGGNRATWPKGINADLTDPAEWQFLKEKGYWGFICQPTREA